MSDGIQYSRFAVDRRPCCVWEWDLSERNLAFIESIDPGYFAYLANVHERELADDSHKQHAAMSIRMAYSHGLETLFAFLLAAVQAPDCVVGWVHAYTNAELRQLVQKVQQRKPVLSKLDIDRVTWKSVSTVIHGYLDGIDEDVVQRTSDLYARAWARLAADFLREPNRHEYNSIKHGLRAHPGGFRLAVGADAGHLEEPARARMRVLADSEFGSSFYVREKIGSEAGHFRVRRHGVNWSPEDMACGLHLIHCSLHNVQAFLRVVNGADSSAVQYIVPLHEEDFDQPWATRKGTQSYTIDHAVTPGHIMVLSAKEILAVYDRHC